MSTEEFDAMALWARSGGMALTRDANGRPAMAGAGAAAVMAQSLRALEESATARTGRPVDLPGVELVGERAAVSGQVRKPGFSVGGATRTLHSDDGWLVLALPRDSDRELVPALVEARVDPDTVWCAIEQWARVRPAAMVVERAQLLGMAAAVIPTAATTDAQLRHRGGRPVLTVDGGPRRSTRPDPRVIDLSALWAGPLCAHLLGLMGARVVKVESVDRPDGARRGPRAFYDLLHDGHEEVAVDFRTEVGRRQLRDLLADADVVIESSRPRAMAQLGVDVAALVAQGVIWTSITAYGRTGPWAERVGFGDDVAAAAGLVACLDGVPVPVADAVADPLAGAAAAAATAAALLSDRSRLIDVSMRDVARAAALWPVPPATLVADRTIATGWRVDTAAGSHPVLEPRARTA